MIKRLGWTSSSSAAMAVLAVLTLSVGGCWKSKHAGEAHEQKVELSQVPAPVRQTLTDEARGANVSRVEKETKHGKTVYEAEAAIDGKTYEIKVAEDGSLISKKLEDEHEKGEQAGKHEKHEKGESEDDEHDEKDAEEKVEKHAAAASGDAAITAGWREQFQVDKSALKPTGDNAYLAVQPGRVLKLTDGKDTLTVTILPETKTIDGVACGVLEERETKDGKLIEISRNFFATDPATNDVYYFGEDVDNYKDGQVTNHESAWHAGEKGARFGLMVPGQPKAGDKFYQEIAPKVAMDRVEIVSTDETVKTPAGTFEHCLHLKETTPIEGEVSHKYYAPGVGVIKDDGFELAEKP